MFNTLMKTAHDLLLNTIFFIMAIAVLAGAFSALISEFGIVALINYIISPIMKPLYNLPGAASIGAITTFLSDNPAIISLANDKGFAKYFKNYQLPTLCNLGTAFGMGLIVWTFMGSQGNGVEFLLPATLGVLGAVVGSIVSVRIMMHFTKKYYNYDPKTDCPETSKDKFMTEREIRDGNAMERALEAMLDGGKTGVDLGLAIIPGVIIICTLVMIFTMEPAKAADGAILFTGAAYEGVGLLPKLGALLSPILTPLFGFTSPKAIAFPITSLGSVGAALGMVPKLLAEGAIGGNEIAVFTAMGMCWSGYLSTHVGMMDALGVRKLTNNAIFSHTIGGLAAGIAAHFFFMLSQVIF
jgi:nucleoside recognition membrane protein YjiH